MGQCTVVLCWYVYMLVCWHVYSCILTCVRLLCDCCCTVLCWKMYSCVLVVAWWQVYRAVLAGYVGGCWQVCSYLLADYSVVCWQQWLGAGRCTWLCVCRCTGEWGRSARGWGKLWWGCHSRQCSFYANSGKYTLYSSSLFRPPLIRVTWTVFCASNDRYNTLHSRGLFQPPFMRIMWTLFLWQQW